jgi:uncharacterized membrane protein
VRSARPPLGAVALALSALATNAHAWLKLCNKTDQTVNVAIAIGEKDAADASTEALPVVTVEGWWKVAPGQCSQVSGVDAAGHWVYYHAHAGSRAWEGTSRLCVRSLRFNGSQHFLDSNESCRGEWRAIGFRRTDAATRNHTVNLT